MKKRQTKEEYGFTPEGSDASIAGTLQRHIDVFVSAAGTIPGGSSEPFSWGGPAERRKGRWIGAASAQPGDVMALCSAAKALVDEMVRTRPDFESDAWWPWYDTLCALNGLLAAIGVGKRGGNAAAPLSTMAPRDMLGRLPLPRELHGMVQADARGTASVLQFLELMLAAPQATPARGEQPPLALCMLLFAATCVASPAPSDAEPGAQPFRAAERGHAWLIEHLPRRVHAARAH